MSTRSLQRLRRRIDGAIPADRESELPLSLAAQKLDFGPAAAESFRSFRSNNLPCGGGALSWDGPKVFLLTDPSLADAKYLVQVHRRIALGRGIANQPPTLLADGLSGSLEDVILRGICSIMTSIRDI